MAFKLGMTIDLCMAYVYTDGDDDLDLDTGSQWIVVEDEFNVPIALRTVDRQRKPIFKGPINAVW